MSGAAGPFGQFLTMYAQADKDRTVAVVSNEASNTLLQILTIAPITKIETRSGRSKTRQPGWISVNKGDGDLERDSYVRFDLECIERNDVRRTLNYLSQEAADAIRVSLRDCLSRTRQIDLEYFESFLKTLPPPSRRGRESNLLTDLYNVLDRVGWRAPRQGDVLSFPDWHTRGGAHFAVVSNTELNLRHPYPQILVVPLLPLVGVGGDVAYWTKCGRIVVDGETGVTGAWLAAEEGIDSFDPAQDWLEICNRCYSPRHGRVSKWFSARKSGCVSCDRIAEEWPSVVGHLGDDLLARILSRVHTHLAL